MATVLHLIQAEWLKLTRRPLTWLLYGTFVLLMLITFAALLFVVLLHDGAIGGVAVQVLNDNQINQFRQELRFPGVFGALLGQINSIGGILAMILAAGVMGNEYSWGTLRVQLARQPQRGYYLTAKLLTLLLVLLVGMLLVILAGGLFTLIAGWLLGNLGRISAGDLGLLLFGMLRALYVMLPYVLFVVAVSIIGRSVLAGVAGGLIFLTLDGGAGALSFLSQTDNAIVRGIYNLLLQPNISRLVTQHRLSFGLDPTAVTGLDLSTLPPTWQAILVIGVYSCIFAGYAYVSFTRRDIAGAG